MEEALVRYLSKFKKKDYFQIPKKWQPLKGSDLDVRTEKELGNISKAQMIKAALKHCQKKRINVDALSDLDLITVQMYSSSKLWHSFEILDMQNRSSIAWTAERLKIRFMKEMRLCYREVSVSVTSSNDLFWIRLGYTASKRKALPNVSYLVLSTGAKKAFLCATSVKAAFIVNILQVVLECINGNSANQLNLKGKTVESLLKLMKYKECKDDGVPWQDKKSQKRKACEMLDLPNVVNENREEKKRRLSYIDKIFGTEELPTLEKIEYKMETNFRGLGAAPRMADKQGIFPCNVKFSGSSVLNGIRNLAAFGLATVPMKEHIKQAHLKGRSTFIMRARDTNNSVAGANSTRNLILEETSGPG